MSFGIPLRNGLPIGLGSLAALAQNAGPYTPPPVQTYYILMEDNSKLLQEDASKLLLEAA